MKPESSLESDQKASANSGNAQTAAPSGGVTGMFETLAGPVNISEQELADLLNPPQPQPAGAALPPPSSPFVHEVAVGTATPAGKSDPLASLLRSSPPARPATETLVSVPPAAPVANGGFTQLLRALNQDQFQARPVAASPAPPTQPAAPPVTSFPASQAGAPVSQPEPASTPGQPGSFTQLFRALDSPPKPGAPGSQVVVGGAFTQQANSQPATPGVSEQKPAEAAPAPASGSFTQLFQALDSPAASARPAAKPVAPPQQVVVGGAFDQQPASPVPPPAVPPPAAAPSARPNPAPGAPSAGSFTQLFQALGGAPATPDSAPSPSSLPLEPAPAASSPQPLPPQAAGIPGSAPPAPSITQLFQTQTQAEPAAEAREPAVVRATEPEPSLEPPPSPPTPGAFTQMLNAAELSKLRGAAPASTPVAQPAAPPQPVAASQPAVSAQIPVAPQPGSSGPGSFTQLFSAEPFKGAAAPSPASLEPASAQQPPASGVGTFTQLFRTLESPPPATSWQPESPGSSGSATETFAALPSTPEPTPAAFPAPSPAPSAASSGPGGFTQLFRSLETPSGAPAPPNSSGSAYDPFAPPPTAMSSAEPASGPGGSLGASQMFSGYSSPVQRQAQASAPPAQPDFGYAAPQATPPPAINQGGAGLTQLLRTLEQPGASAAPQAAYPQEPVSPAGSQPSVFTAAYQTLNTPGTAPVAPSTAGQPMLVPGQAPLEAPPAPQAAAAAPAAAGPSEFTRILNASALREAGLRAGGVAASAGGASGAAAQSSPGGGGLPGMPKPPATPSVPGAPAMPHAPAAPAAPAMPQFKMPEAQPPVAKAPEAPAAASPQTKLQQYLPLLLILIIFVLVAILIAVVVLLKH